MGEMARTLVFTGEKQIEIQEYPIPEVSDDMVLVKTDACAICTWEQRVLYRSKKSRFSGLSADMKWSGRLSRWAKNVDQRQWSVGDFVAVGVTLAHAKTAISVRAEMSRTVNILITANS